MGHGVKPLASTIKFRLSIVTTTSFPLVLLLFLCVTDVGANDGKWLQPERSNLENTKGALPFAPSRATTGGKSVKPQMFESSEICSGCHQEIYKQWKGSVMAHSWVDPIYGALLKRASRATDGRTDNFCMGCHTPVGLTTHQAKVQDTGNDSSLPGVNCVTCHNISALTGTDNGAYVLTPNANGRPLMYGPRKDAESPYHSSVYSELHTRSEFCSSCHNVTHPFTSAPIERTYDEWLDSPYNEKGIQCQDCHMTLGPGVTINPGKSAIMGREREHIYSHYFVGANSTLHNYFGLNEMAELSRNMLKSAATIELVNPPEHLIVGQPVTVEFKVTNVGAGHKLPTGFPEGREVWIDFQVTDRQGREIYRSGAISDGHTEKGTKSFKVYLGDVYGEVVDINVWEVTRVLSDTRILPMGYAIVNYTFFLPPQVKGPITLKADLNYWPFPQKIVDELLGEGTLKVEIVRMTSVEKQIDLVR